MLRSAWALATAGRGGLVMVESAAGNGKSTLLAATAEEAAARGLRVLRARGSELERGLAFGVVRQLFETVVTTAPPARRAELLAGAAAPAERVLALDSVRDAPVAAADSGFAALHGIYWLVTNLAQAKPMLLVVDDLHWVDPSSVHALAYLTRRITDLPVALVVALRPDEPATPVALVDALRAEPEAVQITLRALGPPSVASIVRAAIPGADDALCAACFSATSGNPLYLRELLRTIAGERRKATASMVDHAAVPTLGDGVIWRIARIGPEAVALARAMAVLDGGRLADAAVLAGLGEPVAAALAALMRRIEVLAQVDPAVFVHPLVRRSVYETLSVTERDAAHAAAARRLRDTGASPEAVAAHLAAVRPVGQAHVVASLREAARDAMRHAAPETAIRWLERALDEAAPRPPRGELLHELGGVEVAIRSPAAIGHLQEALELTAEPGPRARISFELTEILVAAGQNETAMAAVSGALARPGDLDPGLAADLEAARAGLQAYDPRLVGAFDVDRERLRRLARGDSWGARALAALIGCVAVLRGEDLAGARRLIEHALSDGGLFADHDAGGWASAQVLMALISMDANDRAAEAVEDLAAYARRSGALIGTLTAMGYRGWLSARRGDLVAAEADLRTTLDVCVQNGMPMLFAGATMFLQDAVLERPSLERCRRVRGISRARSRMGGYNDGRYAARNARTLPPGPWRVRVRGAGHAGLWADPGAPGVRPSGLSLAIRTRAGSARRGPRGSRGAGDRGTGAGGGHRPGPGARYRAQARGPGARRRPRARLPARVGGPAAGAPPPGSSTRDRWSSTAPRCVGAASAPRRGSRWPPGWSSPTAAARSDSSPGPRRNCGSPGPGRAASSAPASTRSPRASCAPRDWRPGDAPTRRSPRNSSSA